MASTKPDYFWTDENEIVRPGHYPKGVRLSEGDRKVLEVLRRGPATKRALISATGLTEEQVKWHTRKLREKGIIYYDSSDGQWKLKKRGIELKLNNIDWNCSSKVREKARRLIDEGKVNPVSKLADGTIVAQIEGDSRKYFVAYNPNTGKAACQCEWSKHHPERACSHELALKDGLSDPRIAKKVSSLPVQPRRKVPKKKPRTKAKKQKPQTYIPHMNFAGKEGNVNEKEWLKMLIETGQHVLLEGPTGCGKSMLVGETLEELGLDPVVMVGDKNLDTDIAVNIAVGKDGTKYFDGLLTKAMREGRPFVIEEINKLNPTQCSYLLSAMSEGEITIPFTGEVVRAKPGFRVIATMNYGYVGTMPLADALRARFVAMRLDYLPPNMEKERLVKIGVPQDVADTVVRIAEELRKRAEEKGLPGIATSRGLTFFAKIYTKCMERFGKVNNTMLRHIIASSLIRTGTLDPAIEKSLLEGCVDLFLKGGV